MEPTIEDHKVSAIDPDDFNAQLAADTTTQQDIYANNVTLLKQLCTKYYKMGQKKGMTGIDIAEVKKKFFATLKSIDDQAMLIEKDEATGKLNLDQAAQDFINEINARHSKLIHDVRNPQFNKVFDSFVQP